jgi:hypothetical protein
VGGQGHAPAALFPGKNRYPFYRKLGGPQGRNARVRKISLPTGIPSTDRPARSFPGPQRIKKIHPKRYAGDVRYRNFVGWFVLVRNITLYFEGKKQIPTVSKQNNTNMDMFARNSDEMACVCNRSLAGIVSSNPTGGMNVNCECCMRCQVEVSATGQLFV